LASLHGTSFSKQQQTKVCPYLVAYKVHSISSTYVVITNHKFPLVNTIIALGVNLSMQ